MRIDGQQDHTVYEMEIAPLCKPRQTWCLAFVRLPSGKSAVQPVVCQKMDHRLFCFCCLSALRQKGTEMIYRYDFLDGSETVDISEEWAAILEEMDKEEEASNKKEKRRHLSLDALLFDGEDFAAPGDAETPLLETETREEMTNLLVHLTPTQRRRMLLRADGLTYREIAALEKIDVKSCEESIKGAVKKIRKYF